ncbi:ammonium transporter [Cellulomonas triticagri]|uniref:Ammonium transporter n=1 Tax=Cellulomonas triticagri TaxID=2483352 RepID=A0A3M2JG23_9CELL|nr:ammonium transporter [Cellulomonas triticagri]RMI12742.1 ammonium transporter [Cellulomonas triticagri]
MEMDTGATAWMLMSASLVLLMTPGLAFFYGGMVRSKSVLNMMMMSFISIAVVVVVYVFWGWSMSYGSDVGGLFGNPFDQFGLSGAIWDENGEFLIDGYGVPAIVGVAFQVTFAIITVALISGAIADRVKFGTWVAFTALWATVSYFPLAHMVWGGGALSGSESGIAAMLFGTTDGAATVAPIDFAGGTVVHINAGIAGLVLALIIGKRKGFGKEPMRPHNLPFVMLGAALLWFGWFGFNAGSAFTADGTAGLAWVNTTAATAAAIIGWLITEKIRDGHATSLGAASGIVAGLVAITPAAGALRPVTAIILGVVAGVLCALAVGLKYKFGFDDSLDVVGVHLVGGLVGTIGIGFLAAEGGLFFGDGVQLLVVQVVIALLALVFSGLVTAVIGFILKATLGWRVSEEAEVGGIDLAVHGETAYETLGGARVVTEVK